MTFSRPCAARQHRPGTVAWLAPISWQLLPVLIFQLSLFLLIFVGNDRHGVDGYKVTHYRNYVNGTHGYIQTPAFPRRFPTPISCQWLIHAPPGKKIVLYFTQYYMRESFQLSEYDYYESPESFRGKHDLGEISFEDEVTSYTVYKSYLMLSFRVHEIGNIHLRVYDFLLDVYGFNITYEIVDRQAPVRKDACSVFKCSFLGNCLATRNFETYKCHCFAGFFGDDCQYGPYCNPDKGINMCRNQGKCRYFYGSLVNTCECPPGYHGVLCEKKQEDFGDTECEKIGCEQKCIKDESGYSCACHEGYRLSEDNKTCVEKGRMRYHIQARCLLESDQEATLLDVCPRFEEQITERITATLTPRLQEIGNFSITDISPRDSGYFNIEVVFIGEKADTTITRNSFYDIIRSGKVCECRMDRNIMNFDAQPALHMLTLENFDSAPVLAGHLLTLVCRVKGSDGLQFKWFKDGAPVYVHRTKRNMWITNIPTSDGESRTSVLNVDNADMLDAGSYSCMATDWGETKVKSVEVSVTPKPHLEVTPMVITVMEGEIAKLQCLSGDDKRGKFKYVWFRGDARIGGEDNPEEEVVEDLFPVGSRLTIKAGPQTWVYTCEVTAPSGQANSSSQVTVARIPMETSSCPEETNAGVTWQQTAANRTDLKVCPQASGGRARRTCVCLEERECQWEVPDFSGCVNPELRKIEKELKKLQLGYMVSDVPVIVKMLQGFLQTQDPENISMGDIKMSMKILTGCLTYLRKFYPPTTVSPSVDDVVQLASIILERSRKGSPKEREAVAIGEDILDLFGSIRRDKRVVDLAGSKSPGVTSKSIDLQLSQMSASSMWDSTPLYSGRRAAVTVPHSLQANTLARSRRSRLEDEATTKSSIIITAVYENIQELLSNDSIKSRSYIINSQVVSVGPFIESNAYEDTPEPESHHVDIRFAHSEPLSQVSNITTCLHWKPRTTGGNNGEWERGKCTLLETRKDSTSCRCSTPGHYVVVMTSDKARMQGSVEERVAAITLTGSTIALIFMVASLLIHIVLWCHMNDDLKVITLNLCIFAICLIAVMMATFSGKQSLTMCRSHLLLAITCYTGTFAFLTLELIYIRFSMLKSQINLTPAKILLLGYGIVVLVMSAILICGQVIGYSEMSGRYCWIVFQTWELYAFIAPSTILVLTYTTMFVLLLRDVSCLDLSTPKNEKRKYLFLIFRSSLVQALVATVCILSITMVNNGAVLYQSIYALSIAALGIFFFVAHCFILIKLYGCNLSQCIARIETVLFNKPKTQIPSLESNGSIKAFLRPNDSSKEDTIERASLRGKDDPYRLNKNDYVKDKKDQIKALLGNSSDSASSSKESDTRDIMRTLSVHSSDLSNTGMPKPYSYIGDPPSLKRASSGEDNSAASQRSGMRVNHNALCDCGKCGSDLPFKPTRGQAFILSDEAQLEYSKGLGEPTLAVGKRSDADSADRGGNDSQDYMEEGTWRKPIPTHDMLELVPSYVRIEPLMNSAKGRDITHLPIIKGRSQEVHTKQPDLKPF